ncbi:MAG: hypothetical protein JWP47_1401 [Polaromonas sp.]|jgi:hypothetical protein|nr:hypothetical protein [Polaromonas sp.]
MAKPPGQGFIKPRYTHIGAAVDSSPMEIYSDFRVYAGPLATIAQGHMQHTPTRSNACKPMDNKLYPDFWRPLTLHQLQKMKQWNAANHLAHPFECRLWDAVLTAWMMGWMGWLPSWVFSAGWAYPLCLAAVLLPQVYVYLRAHAHLADVLRCDWLEELA